MKILAFVLCTAYIIYLIWEKQRNNAVRASFKHVIHVNGIRGKTGTARMIDAVLRAGGYRVFTKTTGSDAVYIGTDGKERAIRRIGPPGIGEQLGMLRKAQREGAEIVVIECMAVNPELQRVCQDEIVRGDINVITNVRYDHIFEMGPGLTRIAASLANTVPEKGILFTADEDFYDFFSEKCREKGSECILCRGGGAEDENTAIAFAVGEYLGIGRETLEKSAEYFTADYGTKKIYSCGDRRFINLFSANDPQSTEQLLDKYAGNCGEITFVFNNRGDRPDRVMAFAEHFFDRRKGCEVLVTGENRSLACRILNRAGVKARKAGVDEIMMLRDERDMAGIGNIKGAGERLLSLMEGADEK